ncbi:MAG TPA: hypothetical protein VHD32_17340 [Candidatus Didemnitutus sp.]|nr:hypothetical protein [Candidatus Didemnitutus sp.]
MGIGLILALGVGLAFVPGVQRWALLRALAGQRGVHLEVDHFSAGPSSFSARGVRLEVNRTVFSADQLEGDLSLFDLFSGSRLEIKRLAGANVVIDASRASRNRLLAGVFAAPAGAVQMQLPWAVVIGELDLAGTARLPGSTGRPDIQATFKLTGGQISPGHEGTLRLRAHLVDPMPGARVAALDFQAALQLKQSTGRAFDRVGITALIDAAGPQISGDSRLKVAAELMRLSEGETYRFHIDTLINGRAADILDARARRGAGPGNLSGDWTLTATSAQIEPFIIGGNLPEFDGKGQGTFRIDPGLRAVAIAGSLQGSASELETVLPALHAVGRVTYDSRFDFAADSAQVRFTRLEASLAGAQPVLQLHAAGPLALDLKNRRLATWRLPTALPSADDNEMLRLRIAGLPLAWVSPFVPGVSLSGSVNGELALVAMEGSRLAVRSVTPFRVTELAVKRSGRTWLSKAGLSFDATAEWLATGLRIQSGSVQLSMPGGDSLGGRLAINVPAGKEPVLLSTDLSGEVSGMFGHWIPGVHAHVQGGGETAIEAGRWDIHRATLEVMDEHGQRLLSLAAARPFSFFPDRLTIDDTPPDTTVLRVGVGRLPLGALGHLPGPYRVDGIVAANEFLVKGGGDKLSISCTAPLQMSEFMVARAGERELQGLAVECAPTLEFSAGQATRLALGDVQIRDSAGGVIARLNAEVAGPWPDVRAQASFNVDLPLAGAQPGFQRAAGLSAGRAVGEFRAAILPGGALQTEARATVNGLVHRDGAKVLPVANLSLRTLTRLDGTFSIEAPILIDSAGIRSDLKLAGEGSLRPGGSNLEAHLTGDHVDLGDLMLLLGAGGGASEAATADHGLSPPAADPAPFWAGWEGNLDVNVKEVARGREWSATNVSGRATATRDALNLEKLTADLGGTGKFSAVGDLVFGSGPDPYEGHARVVLADFDSGKFFRGLDPDAPPPFEGTGTLRAKWESTGLTWADTWSRARAEIDYTSNGGIFRGLKRASDKVSMASKAVEWSAALGSLLKTGKVKEAAEKVAGSGYYIDQLALALGEFNYDQFSFHLVRQETGDLQLASLALVSPEIELQGTGAITTEEAKRWSERPLRVSLTLGARGRVEQMLGRLKLLEGTRDAQDYAKAKDPIVVSGTVAHPDALSYYLGLLSAKPAEPEDKKAASDHPPATPAGPSSP